MVDIEKVAARQLITKWFDRARIDYSDLYVKQYIAYNAWFRKVTQCTNDKEAIGALLKRFVIWDDYLHGRTLITLGPILEQIAILTYKNPVRPVGSMWDGTVKDVFDWQGLIYFWYQTRCDLFHGSTLPGLAQHDIQVKLAYESLHIFMAEIVQRMRHCFTDVDFERLTEVRVLLRSGDGERAALREIEEGLYRKFVHSPDMWNVDMIRT